MNVKPLKIAGLVSIIIGLLFTLTGGRCLGRGELTARCGEDHRAQ